MSLFTKNLKISASFAYLVLLNVATMGNAHAYVSDADGDVLVVPQAYCATSPQDVTMTPQGTLAYSPGMYTTFGCFVSTLLFLPNGSISTNVASISMTIGGWYTWTYVVADHDIAAPNAPDNYVRGETRYTTYNGRLVLYNPNDPYATRCMDGYEGGDPMCVVRFYGIGSSAGVTVVKITHTDGSVFTKTFQEANK